MENRLYADLDFLSWPLLTVCFTGLLTARPGYSGITARYRELSLNATTINSSVNHDYILRRRDGVLVEFGHSMRAAPELPELRQDGRLSDDMLDQAEAGRQLLRKTTGGQLELTTGDCGVLFDRLVTLLN